MDRLPNLFYIHIPKTGGVSIENILSTIYSQKRVSSNYRIGDFFTPEGRVFRRHKLNMGHIPYFCYEVMPRPLTIFTVFREPVHRTISVYNHIRMRRNHPYHRLLMQETNSIVDFIHHPELSRHISEVQTRYIGCQVQFSNIYRKYIHNKIDSEEANESVIKGFESPPDEFTLNRAKERMIEMPVVGILEQFDKTCDFLLKYLNVQYKDPYPHLNTVQQVKQAITYGSLSDEEIREIRTKVKYDLELYSFAQQRFDELLRDAGLIE